MRNNLIEAFTDDIKGFIVDKIFKIAETASKEQSRRIFKELLANVVMSDARIVSINISAKM